MHPAPYFSMRPPARTLQDRSKAGMGSTLFLTIMTEGPVIFPMRSQAACA